MPALEAPGASAACGVTLGAGRQQVLKAEAQLNRPVFEGHANGLRLTPFGQEVLRHLSAGFTEISAGPARAGCRHEGILERKTEVQPHSMADHFSRKAVTRIAGMRGRFHPRVCSGPVTVAST